MALMAKGTVRLKGGDLKENYSTSMYRMSKDGDVSYDAVHKYITTPEKAIRMDGTILYAILTNLGLDREQVLALPLGDVFDIIDFEVDA